MALFGGALSKALDNDGKNKGEGGGLIQKLGGMFRKSSSKSDPILMDSTEGNMADPSGYKKGGKVKKTGMAKVHKNERILTRKQARKYGQRKSA